MYVYIESDGEFMVGFYTSDYNFAFESTYATWEAAAARVSHLNGELLYQDTPQLS